MKRLLSVEPRHDVGEHNPPTDGFRRITADDVRRFAESYHIDTRDGALRFLQTIGVRFKKNGQFSHVVPL